VRTSSCGQADPINVANSFREGWVAVKATEYPELNILSDPGSRYPDGIEVGGLLLCSAPASVMKARSEHYAKLAQAQIKSVNDQLEREEDPRFRTMFRQSSQRVTRGFGPNGRGARQEPPPEF
jgi:hypothetical protein